MNGNSPTRMYGIRLRRIALIVGVAASLPAALSAQELSQRGFVEARGTAYVQPAPNDPTQEVGDALVRDEVFFKPASWVQFAGGVDLRANSHDQVDSGWAVDWQDRTLRRPRVAVRRLAATFTARGLTVDVGKQFIRWARADILNPTDRFAPRDYINVIDTEFLPVLGVRPSLQIGSETFEAVWVPRFTPSRLPLITDRWTVLPPDAAGITIVDGGSVVPKGSQAGVRWRHAGERFETGLSYFDGFNHLPNIDVRPLSASAVAVTRSFPELRTYGADAAMPTRWVTLKAEAAYFKSPTGENDDHLLYVVEFERQTGEWVLVGGYAGDVINNASAGRRFSPEQGIARSVIARAAYTVDPRRTVAIETAARQSGDGFYAKGEYSQATGDHWRLNVTGVALTGNEGDFLGQYHKNSHLSVALRFSF
jgi:hypothetical protein